MHSLIPDTLTSGVPVGGLVSETSEEAAGRGALSADALAEWIHSLAPWSTWATLTVDDDKLGNARLTEDWLGGQFRWWVMALNRWYANGRKDYKRKWGHSLFSYCAAFDYGDRLGRLHLHALLSEFDWLEGSRLWYEHVGYCLFKPVYPESVRYLADYLAKRRRSPDFVWVQRRGWEVRKVRFE